MNPSRHNGFAVTCCGWFILALVHVVLLTSCAPAWESVEMDGGIDGSMAGERGLTAADAEMDGGVDGSMAGERGLTAADVVDLPGGSASGCEYSGSYLAVELPAPAECSCRRGECGPVTADVSPDGAWVMTQNGGDLEISMRGGINGDCMGGIDADGSFWCGKMRGDSEDGDYLLLEGVVSQRDGVAIITVDAHVTTTSSSLDCDLHATGSLSR